LSKNKTLDDVLHGIQSLKHQIAINRALANFLRTKYLPRDSISAPAKINCEGAPVPEGAIEEAVARLEVEASDMGTDLKQYLQAEVK